MKQINSLLARVNEMRKEKFENSRDSDTRESVLLDEEGHHFDLVLHLM